MPFEVTKVEKSQQTEEPGGAVHRQHVAAGGRQEARFLSRRTMRAAQDLYEGMDVGEDGPVGLITYMRTDSVRISVGPSPWCAIHRKAVSRKPLLPAGWPEQL